MAKKFVINVDLADVWAERNRKKLIRTLAWGDEVSVVKETRDYAEVDITEFIEEKDGSILPKKATGYIQPPKNLGLKLTEGALMDANQGPDLPPPIRLAANDR